MLPQCVKKPCRSKKGISLSLVLRKNPPAHPAIPSPNFETVESKIASRLSITPRKNPQPRNNLMARRPRAKHYLQLSCDFIYQSEKGPSHTCVTSTQHSISQSQEPQQPLRTVFSFAVISPAPTSQAYSAKPTFPIEKEQTNLQFIPLKISDIAIKRIPIEKKHIEKHDFFAIYEPLHFASRIADNREERKNRVQSIQQQELIHKEQSVACSSPRFASISDQFNPEASCD